MFIRIGDAGGSPIPRLAGTLIQANLLTEVQAAAIQAEAHREIDEAVQFADTCPEPDLSTIEDGVYA